MPLVLALHHASLQRFDLFFLLRHAGNAHIAVADCKPSSRIISYFSFPFRSNGISCPRVCLRISRFWFPLQVDLMSFEELDVAFVSPCFQHFGIARFDCWYWNPVSSNITQRSARTTEAWRSALYVLRSACMMHDACIPTHNWQLSLSSQKPQVEILSCSSAAFVACLTILEANLALLFASSGLVSWPTW